MYRLFDFYHWKGHIGFGFTAQQARMMYQGYIWGASGLIAGLCSWALGGIGAALCRWAVGVIVGALSQAVSSWGTYRYRDIVFTYGWHRKWFARYPYFKHPAAWTWW